MLNRVITLDRCLDARSIVRFTSAVVICLFASSRFHVSCVIFSLITVWSLRSWSISWLVDIWGVKANNSHSRYKVARHMKTNKLFQYLHVS